MEHDRSQLEYRLHRRQRWFIQCMEQRQRRHRRLRRWYGRNWYHLRRHGCGKHSISLAGITRNNGAVTVSAPSTSPFTFSTGTLAIDAGSTAGSLVVNAHFGGTINGVVTKTGAQLATFNNAQTSFAGTWIINAGDAAFNNDTQLGVVPGAPTTAEVTLNNAGFRSSNAGIAELRLQRTAASGWEPAAVPLTALTISLGAASLPARHR